MKLNKKMMAINLLATILMTDVAMAIIKGRGSDVIKGSGAPVNTSSTTTTDNPYTVGVAANTTSCVSDADNETTFPLELFSDLAKEAGAKVDIQIKAGNKIVIKIPSVINVCGSFTPKILQDTVTKNVTVMIQLKDSAGKLVNHKALEDCLINKKIMVDGKIDYSKVPKNGYTESTSTIGYNFDDKADIKKDITVSYAFPKSFQDGDGYKPLYGFVKDAPPISGEACMLSEKIAESTTYINLGTEAWFDIVNNACNSNNLDEVISVKRSVGNAGALSHIMGQVYDALDKRIYDLSKPQAERIIEEMAKIETYLSSNRDAEESKVKKQINKYVELTKELDSKFLNPAIYRLETLMKRRENIDDPDSEEIDAIDNEIRSLNEEIGKFSKKGIATFAPVYSAMEKFALTNQAKVIQDVRLKSEIYSNVYPGKKDKKRAEQFTFETARKRQNLEMQKFEANHLKVWTDVYMVEQGNMSPIYVARKERKALYDRANSKYNKFQQNEYNNLNKYCAVGMTGAVKNLVKCNQLKSGQVERLKRFNENQLIDAEAYHAKTNALKRLEDIGINYEYNQSLAAEAEKFNDYGSTLLGYENPFNDVFSTSTLLSGYQSSAFDYTSRQAIMGLGQSQLQMMMPPQYNSQPGYQHQMPPQYNPQAGYLQMSQLP